VQVNRVFPGHKEKHKEANHQCNYFFPKVFISLQLIPQNSAMLAIAKYFTTILKSERVDLMPKLKVSCGRDIGDLAFNQARPSYRKMQETTQ